MSQEERDLANQEMARLEGMLNAQFINCAYMGGILRSASSSAVAGFAIRNAQAPNADLQMPGRDEQTCHDALCALIKEGHPLPSAASMARRSPLGRAAFERIQERHSTDFERRCTPKAGAQA